jgi:hypothetical protein
LKLERKQPWWSEAGRQGLQEGRPPPAVYEPGDVTYQPCLGLDESYARLPDQARRLVNESVGTIKSWYADVSAAHTSCEYLAIGGHGLALAAGERDAGGVWRLTFTFWAIDPASIRLHEERPGGTGSRWRADRQSGGTGATRALDVDAAFKAWLGRLPSATQQFVQYPFGEASFTYAYRNYRSGEQRHDQEQVWCWIADDRYLTFLYGIRPVPAARDRSAWQVQAVAATLVPQRSRQDIHTAH